MDGDSSHKTIGGTRSGWRGGTVGGGGGGGRTGDVRHAQDRAGQDVGGVWREGKGEA